VHIADSVNTSMDVL